MYLQKVDSLQSKTNLVVSDHLGSSQDQIKNLVLAAVLTGGSINCLNQILDSRLSDLEFYEIELAKEKVEIVLADLKTTIGLSDKVVKITGKHTFF